LIEGSDLRPQFYTPIPRIDHRFRFRLTAGGLGRLWIANPQTMRQQFLPGMSCFGAGSILGELDFTILGA
jgi:hypothetical protein